MVISRKRRMPRIAQDGISLSNLALVWSCCLKENVFVAMRFFSCALSTSRGCFLFFFFFFFFIFGRKCRSFGPCTRPALRMAVHHKWSAFFDMYTGVFFSSSSCSVNSGKCLSHHSCCFDVSWAWGDKVRDTNFRLLDSFRCNRFRTLFQHRNIIVEGSPFKRTRKTWQRRWTGRGGLSIA